MEIQIKGKEGKTHSIFVNMKEWEHNQDWYAWKEWIAWRYPPFSVPSTHRIPDREGESDSFESWKASGKPKPSLFNYGVPVENDFKELKELLGIK